MNGRRDFGLSERVARFAPGDYEPKCINIPIWDDDILEDRETFYVQIRNLTEKVYNIKLENALVMIVDNDSKWKQLWYMYNLQRHFTSHPLLGLVPLPYDYNYANDYS